MKLKFFNDDQKKVYGKKADLRIIDNETYLTDFISERNKIVSCAKDARIMEGQKGVSKNVNERLAAIKDEPAEAK